MGGKSNKRGTMRALPDDLAFSGSSRGIGGGIKDRRLGEGGISGREPKRRPSRGTAAALLLRSLSEYAPVPRLKQLGGGAVSQRGGKGPQK